MTIFKRLMSFALAMVLLIGMVPTVAFGAGIEEETSAAEVTEYAVTESVETTAPDAASEETAEMLPAPAETEAPEEAVPTLAETEPTEETAEATDPSEAVTEPFEVPTMPEETEEVTEAASEPETEPDVETLPEETKTISVPEESQDAALGEADALWKGTCGKNLRWYVDGKYAGRYDLHIYGTGPMDNYDMYNEIYAPWDAMSIERIFIESGVTSIGDLAFWGLPVKSVSIPETVTSIGEMAFMQSDIEKITIPPKVTEIKARAFSDCMNLRSVTFSGGLKTIGYGAFQWCPSLLIMAIPEGVTKIGSSAFQNCTSLYLASIPASVTTIDHAPFGDCPKLKKILVDENNKYFTAVDGILYDKKLTRLINCPGGRTDDVIVPEGVKIITSESMAGCSRVKKVVFPKSVTEFEMFALRDMKMDAMVFKGNAPNILETSFPLCSGKVYYPYNNPTWTEDVWSKLVATELTEWIPSVVYDDGSFSQIYDFAYSETTDWPVLANVLVDYSLLAYHDTKQTSSGWKSTGSNPELLGKTLKEAGYEDLISYFYDEEESENAYVVNKRKGYAGENTNPFTIGRRKIWDRDKKLVDQIVMVFRGTYKAEWNGNFDVTGLTYDENTDEHWSFAWAVELAKEYLIEYINDCAETGKLDPKNLSIVITGHSRGAAVANILAHDLNQVKAAPYNYDDFAGISFSRIFAYTFATPNVATYSHIKSCSQDRNIFNFCFTDDFVPNLPMESWSWGKYGRTFWAKAQDLAEESDQFVNAVTAYWNKAPEYNEKYTRNIVTAIMESDEDSGYDYGVEHYYEKEYWNAWPQEKSTIRHYIRYGLGGTMQDDMVAGAWLAMPLIEISTGPFDTLAANLIGGGKLHSALKDAHYCASYVYAMSHCYESFEEDELTQEGYSKTEYALSAAVANPANCDQAQVDAVNDFLLQKITHESGAELTNSELLGWQIDDPADWRGLTWENGNVVAMDLEYRGVVGDLDLSMFPQLRKANLNSCNLSSLDLTDCENLTELYCSNNALKELDLTACTGLKKLECANNALAGLDLTACTGLEKLDCSGNRLHQLDLSSCIALTWLDCTDNYLDPDDVLLEKTVQAIRNAGGWADYRSQNISTDAVFAQNDLNCLTAIAQIGNNNQILNWNLMNPASWNRVTWVKSDLSYHLESVDLTGLGLSGAADFDNCVCLKRLKLSENAFTELSVSGCDALEVLWCSWNYLDASVLAGLAVPDLETEPQLVGHSLNEADVAALNALSREKKLYWDSRLYGSNAALTWTAGEDGVYSLTGMDLAGCGITGDLDLRAFKNLERISASGVRMRSLILPESVTELPEVAFAGCVALEVVTFTGDLPAISDTAFEELSLCCRYPYGADSWTEESLADYGGAVIWEYDPDTVPPLTTSFVLQNAYGEDVTDSVVWFDANAAESITFTVVRMPENAIPVTNWEYDSALAEVEYCDDGTITLIPKAESGTMELTAATVDGSGVTASVTIRFAALRVAKEAENADVRLLSKKSTKLQIFDDAAGRALTDKQVTWSMDEAYAPYAKIDSKGKLTAKKVLEKVRVEAVASIVGSESTKVTAMIDIFPGVTSLELLAGEQMVNNQTLNVDFTDEPLVLTANIHPLDAMEGVDWVISDKKEAFARYDIDEENGTLTIDSVEGTKAGTVTIKATSTDGSKKTATVKLQFGTYAKSLTIDKSITTLTAGDKAIQLYATMEPAVVTKSGIVWSLKNADDKNYVNLSSSGKITPKNVLAPVDVTIVATSKDGMAKDEHTIRIMPKSQAQLVIKSGDTYVTKTTQILDVNTQESITLAAYTYGEEEMTAVDWAPLSNKAANITLNADGTLTIQMIAAGSINITAKTEDGRKATVTVKGVKLAQGIEISQKKTGITEGLEVASGKSLDLQATLTDAASKKVTWSIVEGNAYATISNSGKFAAAKDLTSSHKVVVKAVAADGSNAEDTMEIMVRPIAQGVQVYSEAGGRMLFSFRTQNWWVRSNTTLNWDLSTQADTIAMAARVYPYYGEDSTRNAMQAVTWKSSAPKIAEFVEDEEGNVSLKLHKTGSVTVTAIAADGSGQKVTFKLNVVKTVTKLTIEDQTVTGGKSLNLAKLVTIEPADATNKKLTWKITSGGEYATISSSGSFKAKKVTSAKTVEVTVSSQDGGASTSFWVTITP